MRSFNLFAEGRGVNDLGQKKALLMHCAGEAVQDIYYTLNEQQLGEGQTVFDMCCRVLSTYFHPRVNVAYERSVFRSISQKTTETIEQFITRLSQKAVYCSFGDNIDVMIRDQVTEKCCSSRLRRKILERGDVTLNQLRDLAQIMESADQQTNKMENRKEETCSKLTCKLPT